MERSGLERNKRVGSAVSCPHRVPAPREQGEGRKQERLTRESGYPGKAGNAALPEDHYIRVAAPAPAWSITLAGLHSSAISTSLATVFMLRAVPLFAAGILSLESAMPSP